MFWSKHRDKREKKTRLLSSTSRNKIHPHSRDCTYFTDKMAASLTVIE